MLPAWILSEPPSRLVPTSFLHVLTVLASPISQSTQTIFLGFDEQQLLGLKLRSSLLDQVVKVSLNSRQI